MGLDMQTYKNVRPSDLGSLKYPLQILKKMFSTETRPHSCYIWTLLCKSSPALMQLVPILDLLTEAIKENYKTLDIVQTSAAPPIRHDSSTSMTSLTIQHP